MMYLYTLLLFFFFELSGKMGERKRDNVSVFQNDLFSCSHGLLGEGENNGNVLKEKARERASGCVCERERERENEWE